MTYTTEPPDLFRPDIEIRVSTRRKKTAGAHWEGDRIIVVVPSHLRGVDRDEMVDHLARRLQRHRPHLHASDAYLEERARVLGDSYLEGIRAASIRWSTAQAKRWGSCTVLTREIRISERLRLAPGWVLDAVIVHELAHLIEPNHNPRFKALENRYPRRREADAFLDGYSLGLYMPEDGGTSGQGGCDDESDDVA
ncbi:MAG TPA: M48 family metallopeptidase [Acidimicrobiales bacterium]|jgi:hypothetical protein